MTKISHISWGGYDKGFYGKMEGSSGVSGAKDAKYIYIKVVGEEPVTTTVLALKRDPLGMLTKKLGRWYR